MGGGGEEVEGQNRIWWPIGGMRFYNMGSSALFFG